MNYEVRFRGQITFILTLSSREWMTLGLRSFIFVNYKHPLGYDNQQSNNQCHHSKPGPNKLRRSNQQQVVCLLVS